VDRCPDLILEGFDQYRGWFQAISLSTTAVSPYTRICKELLSHGFVVNRVGVKLSKSAGDSYFLSPRQIVTQYGADIFRLWVS
jgi:isoleucyl-tRNA synthetase